MRRATVLLTAAAAAVLALPVPASAAPPSPKAAAAGSVLTSVTLSTGAVSVRGLDTVTVTATVTTTGETGECRTSGYDGYVLLERTSKRVWDRSATVALVGGMSCVSDSGGVRTRRADIPVPSTAHGPWRVSDVDFDNSTDLDPRDLGLRDATLAVTGTHRPRLRISVRPQPLVYPARDVRVTVQATYDDTRAPVTTRWIGITDDGGGIVGGCGRCHGNTDSNGRVTVRLMLTDFPQAIAWMPLSGTPPYDWTPVYSGLFAPIFVQPALSAAPAKATVRHGTEVDVNGRALAVTVHSWPAKPRVRIGLQRLVGRHWRTVSEGTVRPRGRFTLVATPPKGRNLYRVGLPTQQTFASATSRTFTIRGM
jgi:hypothetical protein